MTREAAQVESTTTDKLPTETVQFVYVLLQCFPQMFTDILSWVWDPRPGILKRMPILERMRYLQRPAFHELLPYLEKPKEIIKRTPEINEEKGGRIRKRKQINIDGWGIETAVKIDFYFKEAVGKYYDITDEGQGEGGFASGEVMENAYYDAVCLQGDKSYQVSVHDFDFNDKRWNIDIIRHFVYMGYLDGSRLSLSEVLWNEKSVTWDVWQQIKSKVVRPDDCQSMTLQGERWGKLTEVYDYRKSQDEITCCELTGKVPYDFESYIFQKKERKVMIQHRYFEHFVSKIIEG